MQSSGMQAGLWALEPDQPDQPDRPDRPDQLRAADPAFWPVHPGWEPLVQSFWRTGEGTKLHHFLRDRVQAGAAIFPPQPLRALELTGPSQVRVVILGQDPYHGRGQAEGLAFSVAPDVAIPPSLRNVFKELQRDGVATAPFSHTAGGSLAAWAAQGVLLLNTCLTVEEARPASHAGKGWEVLTDAIIRTVSEGALHVVFMLWGAHAQAKRAWINEARHLVLTANHPSPLSALRPPTPFLGCGHFSRAHHWLAAQTGAQDANSQLHS